MIREKKCLSSCPLIQAQNLQCFIGHFFGQIFSSCHLLKQNLRCKRELTTLTREQFWSLYTVLAEQLRKCSLWPNIINLTPCPVRVGSYFGSRWPIRPPARVWPPNDHQTIMTMTRPSNCSAGAMSTSNFVYKIYRIVPLHSTSACMRFLCITV